MYKISHTYIFYSSTRKLLEHLPSFSVMSTPKSQTELQNMAKQLFDAAKCGETKTVKLLLDSGVDINQKNSDGLHAIHCAALNGHTKIVQLLLDHSVDVNIKDNNGLHALHYSSVNGQIQTIQLLLDRGVDINVKNNGGLHALHFAAANGQTSTVNFLLNRGVHMNIIDDCGWHAIHQAAYMGHTETVKLLLNRGVDVNVKNNDGWSTLHFAADNGHTETVKLLLQKDVDIFAKDAHGNNALYYAQKYKKEQIEKLLLARIKCLNDENNANSNKNDNNDKNGKNDKNNANSNDNNNNNENGKNDENNTWNCPVCTFINNSNDWRCTMCEQGVKNVKETMMNDEKLDTNNDAVNCIIVQKRNRNISVNTKNNLIKEAEEVYSWLHEIVHLPQYFDMFIDNGYDSMVTIMESLDEDDLQNTIGIEKKGHRKKIMIYIEKLKKNKVKGDEYDNENNEQGKEGVNDNALGMIGVEITNK